MSELYEVVEDRLPSCGVLVSGLDNWIDAGFAAGRARGALVAAVELRPLARFDADRLVDHQARRPTMHLTDGVNTAITWPTIELHEATDSEGRTFLYLAGAEPDHQWRAFTADVVDLARRCGVEMVTSLGAYPAPVPHTRPAKVVATATSNELAGRIGFVAGTLEVPAGINAALERACADAGLDAAGLWAQVPHYVANFPYPGAAIALLEGLARLSGLRIPVDELVAASVEVRQRIDELVAANPDHVQMVRQLEQLLDQQGPVTPIPSGEELAAELEQFLRRERGS